MQTLPGTMANSTAPPAAPAGPTPYDRATAPGLWQATGNNVEAQNALLQQWGMAPLSGNGTGTLPTGEQIDMRRGARSGDNTAQWMGVGGGAAGGAGGLGGSAALGAGDRAVRGIRAFRIPCGSSSSR
jgi:hypothetical protein